MQNRTGVVCFWLSSLVGVNQIWTEKAMAPHSSILPGKSHGQRSLVGCSAWGCEESDTTERLHFHFSLSCIGEGNGSPLQCSCLRTPGTVEPGGLPSMGSHRVGHNWNDLAAAAAAAIKFGTGKFIIWVICSRGQAWQRVAQKVNSVSKQ